MNHTDITFALLIIAMAIFVLAAAVTSLGPSDPLNTLPDTWEHEDEPDTRRTVPADPLPRTPPQDGIVQ